ncbi:hypothetical protein F5B17DRAFT_448171 [Nemania serpens]|nr:hypothetical protein F5B17DRAFT_448171 [Nemania serpens]
MAWRRITTAETHLSHHTPAPESVSDSQWSWPYWKFGYTHGGVLFTDLHAEFNSVRCAIQDPYGWNLDVSEIANQADNREAFFALLRQRQSERYAELERAWKSTKSLLVGEPGRWDTQLHRNELWINFVRISRLIPSFGSLVHLSKTIRLAPSSIPRVHNTDHKTKRHMKSLRPTRWNLKKGQKYLNKRPKVPGRWKGEPKERKRKALLRNQAKQPRTQTE